MSSGQHVCRSGKPPPQPTTVEVFRLARGFSRTHAGRTAQPLAQVKSSLLGKADRPKTLSPRHVRHGASPHVSMTLKPPPPHTHTHTHTLSLSPSLSRCSCRVRLLARAPASSASLGPSSVTQQPVEPLTEVFSMQDGMLQVAVRTRPPLPRPRSRQDLMFSRRARGPRGPRGRQESKAKGPEPLPCQDPCEWHGKMLASQR